LYQDIIIYFEKREMKQTFSKNVWIKLLKKWIVKINN